MRTSSIGIQFVPSHVPFESLYRLKLRSKTISAGAVFHVYSSAVMDCNCYAISGDTIDQDTITRLGLTLVYERVLARQVYEAYCIAEPQGELNVQ